MIITIIAISSNCNPFSGLLTGLLKRCYSLWFYTFSVAKSCSTLELVTREHTLLFQTQNTGSHLKDFDSVDLEWGQRCCILTDYQVMLMKLVH